MSKEHFTSGKVSASARRAYLETRPWFPKNCFVRIRGGYKMIGWESQIVYARAEGRGVSAGQGKPAHEFDLIAS